MYTFLMISKLLTLSVYLLAAKVAGQAIGPDCDKISSLMEQPSQACCGLSSSSLTVACDSEGYITSLLYQALDSGNMCTDSTLANLTGIATLQELALDNYVDQSVCPSLPLTLQNLKQLKTLSLQGAKLSSTSTLPVGTALHPIDTLDLSYANLTQWPTWVAPWPLVKNLTLKGTLLTFGGINWTCGLTDLTVSFKATDNGFVDWVTHCTTLSSLRLELTESSALDVSQWLSPLGALSQLSYLSVIRDEHPGLAGASTFPVWIRNMTGLNHLVYQAQVDSPIPGDLFVSLPLVTIDLHGNRLYGDIPVVMSNATLTLIDLSDNELTGRIPNGLADTQCNLGNNPILCAGVGNRWSLCRHCGLVPSAAEFMHKYMVQWIILGVFVLLSLVFWAYASFRKQEKATFSAFLGAIFTVFSAINLFTTIIYLGIHVKRNVALFVLMLITTVAAIAINAQLYRKCCRRFNILVIRRTWIVFGLCALDLNNFDLYKIRMLNLSAYILPIDFRLPVILSWIKVIIADVPHTAMTIYLLMLQSPVAAVLLTCITSGISIVRCLVQFCLMYRNIRRSMQSNTSLNSQSRPLGSPMVGTTPPASSTISTDMSTRTMSPAHHPEQVRLIQDPHHPHH